MPHSTDNMRKVALLTLCFCLSSCSPVGDQYADVDAIGMSDAWRDWIILGRFGGEGPYRLADIKYCEVNEPCNFSHLGQAHTYEGFDDFKIAVLRLEDAEGGVSHVVLRSSEKTAVD